jgi:manganese/zinc/iron transport system substrate-binding protein
MKRLLSFAWLVVVGGAVGCLLMSGCQRSTTHARTDLTQRPISVTCTTGLLADLVSQVGGSRVQVTALMGPGIDPHQYRPSAGDQARLHQADLIIYHGLHLEGKMVDVLERLGQRQPSKQKVVAVASFIPTDLLRPASEGFEGTYDPHFWFDVTLWMRAAAGLRDTLIELDPAHTDHYRQQSAAYLAKLEQLHQEVQAKVQTIPPPQRVLITAHDAFYYFGQRYGLEVRGLQGISTASETSTRDVQALAKFIRERRIRTIFAETSVPEQHLRALLQAAGGEVRLSPVPLYSDALGELGTPADNYLGMIRHNVDTIVAGLRP